MSLCSGMKSDNASAAPADCRTRATPTASRAPGTNTVSTCVSHLKLIRLRPILVTSEWKYDDKSREPAKQYDFDYLKLNRIATATHTTTCRQQYKMRAQIRDQVRIRAPRDTCLISQANVPIRDVWAIEEAFGR